jgi:copper chaperone CopZ
MAELYNGVKLWGGMIMETKKVSIPNITCGHCVMTIQRELGEIDGVSKVEGDPTAKEITVEWDAPATLEKIISTLNEINYPASD